MADMISTLPETRLTCHPSFLMSSSLSSFPQIYMNAAWHGWVIPMFLFLAILRLSLNYLIAKYVRHNLSLVQFTTRSQTHVLVA